MTQRTRSGRASRLGWLATTIALGVTLVATAWINYRGAHDAVTALNRGQADLLEASIRESFMQRDVQIDGALLDTMLAHNEEAGLRYIAVLDTAGSVLWSAGAATMPAEMPTAGFFGRGPLEEVGDRVRFYIPRPPTRAEELALDSARAAGPPGGGGPDGGRRGGPRRWMLFEMEPVLASALEARASRGLALAIAGASILTLAALVFWRTSEQYQEARLRLEEQRRLTLLGEMSAVLAHEIRNPLASLKGNAQLLAERLPADTREHARAERVIAEAARLEALTSDLLDFARSAPLRREPVDPTGVVRTAIDDVAEDGFDVDTTDAPAQWALDPARTRQMLVNILQNARQATPDGRHPRIVLGTAKDRLVCEVRDFGGGLPAGSEERIFDPFFTTRTNGTGLGLAVARRVAEMHGGSLTARNHPEGGAIFRIEIPAGG